MLPACLLEILKVHSNYSSNSFFSLKHTSKRWCCGEPIVYYFQVWAHLACPPPAASLDFIGLKMGFAEEVERKVCINCNFQPPFILLLFAAKELLLLETREACLGCLKTTQFLIIRETITLCDQSFLNESAYSADESNVKVLFKHPSTTFVYTKT